MEPLTLDEFATAPFLVTSSGLLTATAAAVFAELGDPSRWFPMMTASAWHGRVGGVGSEREVAVRMFGRFRETMLAWEPDSRVTFTMTASTSPLVARMGEDFKLTPELGGARLDWTVAAVPTAIGRAATPILRGVLRQMFQAFRPRLERLSAGAAPIETVHGTPR